MTDLDQDGEKETHPMFDGDDLVDLCGRTRRVQAGDLVEVRYVNILPCSENHEQG